jgi:hypothetical protein
MLHVEIVYYVEREESNTEGGGEWGCFIQITYRCADAAKLVDDITTKETSAAEDGGSDTRNRRPPTLNAESRRGVSL